MRETPKALAAFNEYCLLGPNRSLRKLAENRAETGPKPGQKIEQIVKQLKEWSAAHNWQDRAMRYEQERAEEKRRKRDEAIEAMNERHALIGTTQQARALKHIEYLMNARKLNGPATVSLLKLATDLERLARGAPTEHVEQSGNVSLVGVYDPEQHAILLPRKFAQDESTPQEGGDI